MTIALSPVGRLDSQFYFDVADRQIGERIALGKFEPYLTKLVIDFLQPKMVVVDAGANIGYYTVLAAKKGCLVYAFEPNKYNYELLVKNIKLNKVEKLVKAFNLAVGDQNKKVKLYLSKENLGDHSIFESKNRRYEDATMVKLDDQLANTKIDFIKSDTQGAEEMVFTGGGNIIKKYGPVMLFETWNRKINLDNYFIYSIDEYLQFRKTFKDFVGESTNVWATKKSLSFTEKYRDFWFKKLAKKVLGKPKT